jgi:MYXO-CTERM domain-containing protein
MRRVLLVAGVAAPLVVLAISATSGQLLETTNYSAKTGASYVNLAQCNGTSPLNIEFNIPSASGGTYNLFASTHEPSTSGTSSVLLCAETSSTSVNPPIYAGGVGNGITADAAVKDAAISGADVVKKITPPDNPVCDASQENQQIWICAHWTDANANKDVASATGKFILQFAKPSPPTGISAGPGSGKLYVSWTASDPSGPALADHYVAAATPTAGGSTVFSGSVTGTSASIGGLSNGTEYSVVVYAYSIGGNQSDASSPAALATPVAGADFWDVYKDRGGQEQGGCASGGAGALGLLGAVAGLVLRRRKR